MSRAFASTVAFLTMGGAHVLHDDEHKTDLYFSLGDHDVPWKQIWSSLAAGHPPGAAADR